MSFYWAAGGTLGLETLGEGIGELADAREPWFVGLVVVTGFVKLLSGRARTGDDTTVGTACIATGAGWGVGVGQCGDDWLRWGEHRVAGVGTGSGDRSGGGRSDCAHVAVDVLEPTVGGWRGGDGDGWVVVLARWVKGWKSMVHNNSLIR